MGTGVPLDVFSSLRSTAVVTLVAASFSSPIVLKTDAVAQFSSKLRGATAGAEQAPPELVVAGGVQFEKPADWGALGATASESSVDTGGIGTVVAGLCPGGSSGATCTDGTRLTFVAYSGAKGHELPLLTRFQDELEGQLAREFPGYAHAASTIRPGADGIRYLDHTFTWGSGAGTAQRIAAFRHDDGSGVVVMATGPKVDAHAKAIGAFLSSAHEPVEGE